MEKNKQSNIAADEISIKELILKIQLLSNEVFENWKWVFLTIAILIGFISLRIYMMPKTYSAKLTFMLSEENGNSGGLGGISAYIGLGGNSSNYNLEKIDALLKSRTIIQKSLFEKIIINDEDDYIANHIIKKYGYHEKWKGSESMNSFLFKNSDISSFTRSENSALKTIYRKFIGKEGILNTMIDGKTEIMTLEVKTNEENFSLLLVESLFDNLSKFYIDRTVERQKQSYKVTMHRSDSLRNVLDKLQFQFLKYKDTQRNLSLIQYTAKELKYQRELQTIASVYGETRKNLEIAEFALQRIKPFFQVIDYPIEPLSPNKGIGTYIKNAIIGFFLGGFVSCLFLVGRKIYRDTMDI